MATPRYAFRSVLLQNGHALQTGGISCEPPWPSLASAELYIPSLAATSTTLESSANPVIEGEPLTLTATVTTPAGPLLPSGTVIFTSDGVELGSAPLQQIEGARQAELNVVLSVGSHSIVGTYSGDSNFNPSTSEVLIQNVIYNFTGFFAPVDNPPMYNRLKAGSAVPVKFSLSGDKGLNILAGGSPASQQISCDAGSVDELEQTVTAGASSFAYDATADQYTYIWKTAKSWANTCRKLTVTLNDGTSHIAYFTLR